MLRYYALHSQTWPAWTPTEISQSVTDLSQNKTHACLIHQSPRAMGETGVSTCRCGSLSRGHGGAGASGETPHSSRTTSLDSQKCHQRGRPPSPAQTLHQERVLWAESGKELTEVSVAHSLILNILPYPSVALPPTT